MKPYHDLLQHVLDNGTWEENRTGIRTLSVPGYMLQFDLRDGFPAVTTKKLAFKAVVGELIGFLRGHTSAADFRALGCNVWDANANENAAWLNSPYRSGQDDLGEIYGFQWREWADGDYNSIDQIEGALGQIRFNPTSRRIIVTAWNPAALGRMALPPCHLLFQLICKSDNTIHMVMYQRSVDSFLGLPFNIASYALLLELFAAWSGRQAGTLSMMLADVHIYENHMDQVKEQLSREPYPLPKLKLRLEDYRSLRYALRSLTDLPIDALVGDLCPEAIELENYQHHPAIKAEMAV